MSSINKPKTVLDVIENNFNELKLKTFVHSVYYTGEHDFDNPEELLKSLFEASIKNVNSKYCDVPVHGFILIYKKYYFVFIEGSEESISRQIRYFLMVGDDKITSKFGRSKLLIVYHNILEQSFFSENSLFSIPPTLATKLNQLAPIGNHFEVLETILNKYVKLISMKCEKSLEEWDLKSECLPEIVLIEYILESPYMIDLREFANMYFKLPDHQFSFEKCWPVAYDFTPRVIDKTSVETFVEPLPKEYDPNAPESEEEIEEEIENEENILGEAVNEP